MDSFQLIMISQDKLLVKFQEKKIYRCKSENVMVTELTWFCRNVISCPPSAAEAFKLTININSWHFEITAVFISDTRL